jgi:hypothetical protein
MALKKTQLLDIRSVTGNETAFFESTYPIVMTDRDSLSVEILAPDAGGTGIGSAVNFIVNGDTDV